MDRPGLKQLLAEVQAGRVDVIVVYKVDRLTRVLSDFAKILDVLDAAGASFVSIAQSFNTTTSMGRLTFNVLLSFAQFEREVISERVRDKVAVSKRKGMWMGGSVPLGYTVFIAASELAHALPTMSVSQARAPMLEIDLQVGIHTDHIDATIDLAKLGRRLGYDQADVQSSARQALHIPSVVVRRGKLVQLTILPQSSSSPSRRDPKLIKLVARARARARAARRQLGLDGKPAAIDASCSDADRAELMRLARLSFLAPDIIAAIVDGRQGPEVAVRRLTRMAGLPASWTEQQTMLGFAPR